MKNCEYDNDDYETNLTCYAVECECGIKYRKNYKKIIYRLVGMKNL
jgi:hypothetical protein